LKKGKALIGLGRAEEACQILGEALEVAENLGARRWQWMILDALAQAEKLRGDNIRAMEHRDRARRSLMEVADRIPRVSETPSGTEVMLRKAFLSRPDVQRVINQSV